MDGDITKIKREEKLTRRQFLTRGMKALLGGGLGLIGLGSYSFLYERFEIEVKEVPYTIGRLPPPFKGLRIVQFSDAHVGHYYTPDDLAVAVEQVNALKPDVICFTGDLVEYSLDDLPELIPVLSKLSAPFGKFAVLGNHDYYMDEYKVMQTLEQAGFTVLDNRHTHIEKAGASLYFAGVSDAMMSKPDLATAIAGIPKGSTIILLAHAPDFAEVTRHYSVDFQLSGHSHGGQVRLPLIGHILAPQYGRNFPDGMQQLSHSPLFVYTNRGLGTTILPIRFLCRPEITAITLDNGK